MLAVEIPDAYLVAVLPVLLVSLFGLMAFLLKDQSQQRADGARRDAEIQALKDREDRRDRRER